MAHSGEWIQNSVFKSAGDYITLQLIVSDILEGIPPRSRRVIVFLPCELRRIWNTGTLHQTRPIQKENFGILRRESPRTHF